MRNMSPHRCGAGGLGWLSGWLAGWLVGWLFGWLVGWLVGWLAGWPGMNNWSGYKNPTQHWEACAMHMMPMMMSQVWAFKF